MNCDGVARGKRIEGENGLRGSEAEFFKAAAFLRGAFFDVGLQIFAEQIEAWRDSEVDQDHVGGLREVILDGGGGFSEVVLRKRSAVVSDIDRESFIEGLFVPRNKVAADDLIGEAAFAVKTNFYGVGFFGID